MTYTSPIFEKTIFRELLTVLPAGQATSGPPLGPLLGQFGVNTPIFCKQFNDLTNDFLSFSKGKQILVNTKIVVYEDKTFTFSISKPPVSFLIRQLQKKESLEFSYFYFVTLEDVVSIAQFKFGRTSNIKVLEARCRSVLGSISATDIQVVE
jgi:large subunit ribosomal protein L11